MMEYLKDKLLLTDGQWQEYRGYLKKIEVPAKTILLHENEIPSRIFFVEKGCLRIWFNKDGKDLTLQFFVEGNVVASLESFKKQLPSELSIEAIEPCTLWYITRQDLDSIISKISNQPVLNQVFINFMLERTFNYMKLFFSFIKDTPKQRYLNLIHEKPEIIRRVPQHYIASYLGISTVHLSRIKNQVARNKNSI